MLGYTSFAKNFRLSSSFNPDTSERKNVLRSFLRIPSRVALLEGSGYNASCNGLQCLENSSGLQ